MIKIGLITAAHTKIREIISENKKECVLWLVEYNTYRTRNYNDKGNYESYINEIKSIADKYDNVTLCFYKSKEELRGVINVDTMGQPRSEDAGNQITRFYFYGHGVIGELVLDADMANGWKNKVSWTKEDVKAEAILFKSSISKKAYCDSWACNTATKDTDNQSFADTWKDVYGVKLHGTIGKTDYSPVGDGILTNIWVGITGEYRKPTLGKQNDGKTPSIRN